LSSPPDNKAGPKKAAVRSGVCDLAKTGRSRSLPVAYFFHNIAYENFQAVDFKGIAALRSPKKVEWPAASAHSSTVVIWVIRSEVARNSVGSSYDFVVVIKQIPIWPGDADRSHNVVVTAADTCRHAINSDN